MKEERIIRNMRNMAWERANGELRRKKMANQRHQLTMTDLQSAAASVMAKTDFRAKQKVLA